MVIYLQQQQHNELSYGVVVVVVMVVSLVVVQSYFQVKPNFLCVIQPTVTKKFCV